MKRKIVVTLSCDSDESLDYLKKYIEGEISCCSTFFEVEDVRPVVREQWYMLSYDEAVCTHCGYNRNTPFDCTREAKEKWDELPPFCEMCGADMRREKEEEP